jgi:hypothetical protein
MKITLALMNERTIMSQKATGGIIFLSPRYLMTNNAKPIVKSMDKQNRS